MKLMTLQCFEAFKNAREIANKHNNYYIEAIHLFYVLLVNDNYLLRNIIYEKLIDYEEIKKKVLNKINEVKKSPLPSNLRLKKDDIKDISELYICDNLLNKMRSIEQIYSIIHFYEDIYEFKDIREILDFYKIEKSDFKIIDYKEYD